MKGLLLRKSILIKKKKVTSVKLINKSNQTKIINLKGSLILCSED